MIANVGCLRQSNPCVYSGVVGELDESQEALRNVEQITQSEPVNGEDLLTSPELKRKFRAAKKRLKAASAKPPRK